MSNRRRVPKRSVGKATRAAATSPTSGIDIASASQDQETQHRVLLEAAILWCVECRWPTAQEVARSAGVSESAVLEPYETVDDMRTALVHAERRCWRDCVERFHGDLALAANSRVSALVQLDPRLARLPLAAAFADGVDDAAEVLALAAAASNA